MRNYPLVVGFTLEITSFCEGILFIFHWAYGNPAIRKSFILPGLFLLMEYIHASTRLYKARYYREKIMAVTCQSLKRRCHLILIFAMS